MGILKATQVTVNTTGAAGSATGQADSVAFDGDIVGFYINYHGSAPATTDLVISDKLSGSTLYTKANTATDVRVTGPYAFPQGTDGVALASSVTPVPIPASGGITVALSGCDQLTAAVVVTVYYRK